jgi:hypothetical protein
MSLSGQLYVLLMFVFLNEPKNLLPSLLIFHWVPDLQLKNLPGQLLEKIPQQIQLTVCHIEELVKGTFRSLLSTLLFYGSLCSLITTAPLIIPQLSQGSPSGSSLSLQPHLAQQILPLRPLTDNQVQS